MSFFGEHKNLSQFQSIEFADCVRAVLLGVHVDEKYVHHRDCDKCPAVKYVDAVVVDCVIFCCWCSCW